jgi:hypothetical protein
MQEGKPIFNYATPPRRIAYWSKIAFYNCSFVYVIVGIVVTLPTAAFALAPLGEPYGRAWRADMLFPFAFLSTHCCDSLLVGAALGLLQFPTYCLLAAYAVAWGRGRFGAAVLLGCHLSFAVACIIFDRG